MRDIGGIKLERGQTFIAYTRGEHGSNGAHGNIWACQISYRDTIVCIRSKNYLREEDWFISKEGLIVVPTIRPYVTTHLNDTYLYYSNFCLDVRRKKLSVKNVDAYINTLAQIPQDGQYFTLKNRKGGVERCQLVEYRGDCDGPHCGDRHRFKREEPSIVYRDSKGAIHRDFIIDIMDRELAYAGGEPSHMLNPGDAFVEVIRDNKGEIVRMGYPCYFALEWRRCEIDGKEQEYIECIQWNGRGDCKHLYKWDTPITLDKLTKGFNEGTYVKVGAAFAGKGAWHGFDKYLIQQLNDVERGVGSLVDD